MKKTRLTNQMRSLLKQEVKKAISPKGYKEELDSAYEAAAPLVRKAVHAKYPPKDMNVLAKYNVGAIDDCIKVSMPSGEVGQFNFKKGTGPYVAKLTYENQIYLVDENTAAAVREWADAMEAFTNEYNKRLVAYRALIDAATTVEGLAQVWPEATRIIPSNHLPLALGPEEISIIQNDVEERIGQQII